VEDLGDPGAWRRCLRGYGCVVDGRCRSPWAPSLCAADATDRRIERLVALLVEGRDIPPEEAVDPLTRGTPAQAAERFAAYADAGATWLVLGTIGDDWHAQWKLIAQAATLLD
jgi:hypothetical protein